MRVRGYPPASLCWFELNCTDLSSAKAFYADLFGWSGTADPGGDRLDFRLGDLVAAGATASTSAHAAWVIFMSTEDIDATIAAVTGAGGRVLSPPTTIGNRGRAAVCADPQDATFGLWQHTSFNGTQVQRQPGAPSWGELWTRDAAAATAFYKDVFGWSESSGDLVTTVAYSEFQVAGRAVGGLIAVTDEIPAQLAPRWGTTFEVRDCGAVAARCAELGGVVVIPPTFVEVGTAAYLMDSQGALFCVFEPIPDLVDPALR